jgi:hypothetical protein
MSSGWVAQWLGGMLVRKRVIVYGPRSSFIINLCTSLLFIFLLTPGPQWLGDRRFNQYGQEIGGVLFQGTNCLFYFSWCAITITSTSLSIALARFLVKIACPSHTLSLIQDGTCRLWSVEACDVIPEVVEKTENQLLKVLHTNTVFYTLYTFFHTHDARTNVKISDLSSLQLMTGMLDVHLWSIPPFRFENDHCLSGNIFQTFFKLNHQNTLNSFWIQFLHPFILS